MALPNTTIMPLLAMKKKQRDSRCIFLNTDTTLSDVYKDIFLKLKRIWMNLISISEANNLQLCDEGPIDLKLRVMTEYW